MKEKNYCFSRGRCTVEALTGPVEAFLADLAARKYSPASIGKRTDDLRKLLVYLDARQIGSFADIELKTLEQYRFALVEHGYRDATIESALRTVSLFFRFLEDRGHLFENPAHKLKVPKAPVVLGTVLSEQEIAKLLASPDLASRIGLRDRSILEVIYSTGIRRGEAAGLQLHDVHLDEGTLRVTGKGRKERLLPLGRHAVKYLRLYIREARPEYLPKLSPPPDALWLDRYSKPVSAPGIARIISLHAKASGVGKPIDAHSLRRTCATQMLRGGAHPVVVAQMLGHSGLRSLSHYLQTTITDLQKSHQLSNPGK
jgi:site-specific recombinase XerD